MFDVCAGWKFLELGFKKCCRVLDALYTADLANDYLCQFEQSIGFGNGDSIPLTEDEVHFLDTVSGADLRQGIRFQPGDKFYKQIAFCHTAILYPEDGSVGK